jgi:hypothetical protein
MLPRQKSAAAADNANVKVSIISLSLLLSDNQWQYNNIISSLVICRKMHGYQAVPGILKHTF